jgi:hypothetical protein
VQFSIATRLHELTLTAGGNPGLGARDLATAACWSAFAADDAVQGGARDVIVLSNAHIDFAPLLGQRASLAVSLADGSHEERNTEYAV